MPTYTVRAPNGKTYKITGPAGATNAQIERAVLEAYPDAGGAAPQSDSDCAAAAARYKAERRALERRRGAADYAARLEFLRQIKAALNRQVGSR